MKRSTAFASLVSRSTAFASLVSRIEACRMMREEYNARARQAGMHVKDSSRAGNSRQCGCEVGHYAVGRWRGRVAWSRGSAWRRRSRSAALKYSLAAKSVHLLERYHGNGGHVGQ